MTFYVQPASPKIRYIQEVVASYYGVSRADILSASHKAREAKPRQVAMFLSREMTCRSLPFIGRCFDRDHTTVLYAVRKIGHLKGRNTKLGDDLQVLASRLTPAPAAGYGELVNEMMRKNAS